MPARAQSRCRLSKPRWARRARFYLRFHWIRMLVATSLAGQPPPRPAARGRVSVWPWRRLSEARWATSLEPRSAAHRSAVRLSSSPLRCSTSRLRGCRLLLLARTPHLPSQSSRALRVVTRLLRSKCLPACFRRSLETAPLSRSAWSCGARISISTVLARRALASRPALRSPCLSSRAGSH